MRQPFILWLCLALASLVRGQDAQDSAKRDAPAAAAPAPSSASPEAEKKPAPPLAPAGGDTNAPAADANARPSDRPARSELGKELYQLTCASCHQLHGNGQEALAPPLRNSDWVTGSEGRLVRIVLNGLRGPVGVKGEVFAQEMPALEVLDDEQIAAVLTYVRREWGHTAAPVTPSTVKKIRDETASRLEAWTEEELLKIP